MSNTYDVQTQCDNCKAWFKSKIPIGTTVGDFRATHEIITCTNCGCKTNMGRTL